ncbi:MAG: ferric reductase-like transmembrane domain-containing protein [Parvularculaceae bacterium]|jgi:nitrite reductase/ring-hydroxylating ferredoxin subunit|nr:ferric reductase-like transmembrane domain-containing protein [Parvularculaceae bacterium]
MTLKRPLIAWNRRKIVYDATVLSLAALFAFGHYAFAAMTGLETGRPAILRALGATAFALATIAILIGPAARLAPKLFLPVLYNRRHLGVIAFLIMGGHVGLALTDPAAAPLIEDFAAARLAGAIESGSAFAAPFRLYGLAAFLIFALMAATSHDFWLSRLSPRRWKALHMAVYAAFALCLLHIVAGALQTGKGARVLLGTAGAAGAVAAVIHLAAASRKTPRRARRKRMKDWLDAGPADRLAAGAALIVRLPGDRDAAIFRTPEGLFALSNACSHQMGPLGEGCVRAGVVTCPWHGYEFDLRTGRAPAPYTDRVPVYAVREEGGRLLVKSTPD